jgi:hypothetical protein
MNNLYKVFGLKMNTSRYFKNKFFLKSSPPKSLGQMNRNLVGSIYRRSSIKIAHFIPIRYQTWLPQTNLVSDWLKSTNQKQELSVVVMFVNGLELNEQSKNCLWWSCL